MASVPTNIAEGSSRATQPEFARFLNIAQGSIAEAEYLLILSRDLGYIDRSAADALTTSLVEVARMLHGLRSRLQADTARQPRRSYEL